MMWEGPECFGVKLGCRSDQFQVSLEQVDVLDGSGRVSGAESGFEADLDPVCSVRVFGRSRQDREFLRGEGQVHSLSHLKVVVAIVVVESLR